MGVWNPGPNATSGDDLFTGVEEVDVAYAQAGDDTLNGGGGDDLLFGDSKFGAADDGADVINGDLGDDTLTGGRGSDTISGGEGNDLIYTENENYNYNSAGNSADAGAGDDSIEAFARDSIDGGDGLDFLSLEGFAYNSDSFSIDLEACANGDTQFTALGEIVNIERLNLTTQSNVVVVGYIYDDQLEGGEGSTLLGGAGDDRLAENSIFVSGILEGGEGADTLSGNMEDTLSGGDGDDVIIAMGSSVGAFDNLQGGEGYDRLILTDGVAYDDDDESYYVDAELNSLTSATGFEEVIGRIDGDSGSNIFDLAEITFRSSSSSGEIGATVFGGSGNDTINGSGLGDYLRGEDGVDRIDGGLADDSINGGTGGDFINGGDGDDTLTGGADGSADTVQGRIGNDYLFGSDILDLLQGGAGDDIMSGVAGTLNGGDGIDLLRQQVSLTGDIDIDFRNAASGLVQFGASRISEVEQFNISAYGGNFVRVIGSDLDDNLDFSGATVLLSGAGGDDVLRSGTSTQSADTLLGGVGNDQLFAGGLDDRLVGGEGDDLAYGEAGVDTLLGGEGNDTLNGGENTDGGVGFDTARLVYVGNDDLVLDVAKAAAGTAQTYGDAWFVNIEALEFTAGTGDDFIRGGIGDDELKGGNGSDSLRGGGGSDTLNGGEGDDSLIGGSGGDWLDGGSGSDTVLGGVGGDHIRVKDAAAYGQKGADIFTVVGSGAAYGGKGADEFEIERDVRPNVFCEDGNDRIYSRSQFASVFDGGQGDDWIHSGSGSDTISGGAGADTVLGGAGADIFLFVEGDIGTGPTVDLIAGFNVSEGDRIDLSAIDADSIEGGDQTFSYRGQAAFTGETGQLRVVNLPENQWAVELDIDGDGAADLMFEVTSTIAPPQAGFVL